MVRHGYEPRRSSGRPTHLPPQATAMAGVNALGCDHRAGLHGGWASPTRRGASPALRGAACPTSPQVRWASTRASALG
jgi:hypothetical protein